MRCQHSLQATAPGLCSVKVNLLLRGLKKPSCALRAARQVPVLFWSSLAPARPLPAVNMG